MYTVGTTCKALKFSSGNGDAKLSDEAKEEAQKERKKEGTVN